MRIRRGTKPAVRGVSAGPARLRTSMAALIQPYLGRARQRLSHCPASLPLLGSNQDSPDPEGRCTRLNSSNLLPFTRARVIRCRSLLASWSYFAVLCSPECRKTGDLEEIVESRLANKLQTLTGVVTPKLFAPPPDSNDPRETPRGIVAWRFPEWFVVQEAAGGEERERSRRLVHRKKLDEKGRFDGRQVVATRFVRACTKGHVDDIDWYRFAQGAKDNCRRQIWLDERGTSGTSELPPAQAT